MKIKYLYSSVLLDLNKDCTHMKEDFTTFTAWFSYHRGWNTLHWALHIGSKTNLLRFTLSITYFFLIQIKPYPLPAILLCVPLKTILSWNDGADHGQWVMWTENGLQQGSLLLTWRKQQNLCLSFSFPKWKCILWNLFFYCVVNRGD